MKKKIDLIDEHIIEDLTRLNPRGLDYVAKKLGTSPSTMSRRYKRLRKDGVLKFVAADPGKLGYSVVVIIAINVQKGNNAEVKNMLLKCKETKGVYVVTGRYDIISIMWFRSIDELFQFVENTLSNQPSILSTETFVCVH
jgi:DNA-binding Lrp family transcriptional regulator